MGGTLVTLAEIAQVLDHSLLRPELTLAGLREGCALAREYAVISVCVRPSDLPVAAEALAGGQVRLTTTVGFPHGVTTTAAKLAEARESLDRGAVELDMVLNIGRLCSGEHRYVEDEIRAMAELTHSRGALLKVIFENHYLTDEQKVVACRLSEAAGADFVKTSTGYAKGGATIPDLQLMRRTCSPKVRVKAAGGVSTLDAVLAVMAVGVVRVGTSSTKAIIEEARRRADGAGRVPLVASGALGSGY
jgi:deoxyribose-phosphate aldolase